MTTGALGSAFVPNTTTQYTFTPAAGQCATTTQVTVTINQPVTPTFAAIPAQCAGGTSPLPTTSTNNITGTWSPAFDPNTTTQYTFTPAAGQCATTTQVTVTINQPVTPTFAAIPAQCAGGTSPLPTTTTNNTTGTRSPAFDPNTTTQYTFTPAAGQCATTTQVTVTINQPVTPTFAAIPAQCAGGTSPLPTTSTNNITGTWSPAFDPNTTTQYTFTPAAGQCATTTQVT